MNDGTRGPRTRKIPDGDDRERLVCDECGYIHYENPKIIVGAVCMWHDRTLLCRRAIEPRLGFWTMPAGYMELNETTAEGAAREVLEEAGARVEIGPLLAVYDLPRISQVHMIYLARMTSPDFAAGTESLEVRLFGWDEIPWRALAYPSVEYSLRHAQELAGATNFAPRSMPAEAVARWWRENLPLIPPAG